MMDNSRSPTSFRRETGLEKWVDLTNSDFGRLAQKNAGRLVGGSQPGITNLSQTIRAWLMNGWFYIFK